MNAPFPLGLPLPSALYAVLLTTTFAVHLLAAQFLLGGSALLAVRALRAPGNRDSLAGLVLDWLPFAMGVTITLGVAPLLFVQIVDRHAFYTANLLLFHRWMALLPVLIVAFYLLYLQKASAGLRAHRIWGRVLPGATFLCVLFVAVSWTENHLLSRHPEAWVDFYAGGALFFSTPELWARVATMLALSFPGLAVVGSWLLRKRPDEQRIADAGRLARLALGGLLAGAVLAALTGASSSTAAVLAQPFGLPWSLVAGTGAGISAFLLVFVLRRRAPIGAGALTAAWGLGLLGIAGMREALRWSGADLERLAPLHAKAWTVGGLPVFVVCAILAAALLTLCALAVRRDLLRSDAPPPA